VLEAVGTYDEALTKLDNFSGNTDFNGRQVTLRLTDGGAGDADGVVNGVIVDPGGPVMVTGVGGGSSGSDAAAGAGGSGGGAFGVFLLLWTFFVKFMIHIRCKYQSFDFNRGARL